MRNILLFAVLGCVLTVAFGRPSRYNTAEEREEVEYDSEADDDAEEEDEESSLNSQESAVEEHGEEPQQGRVREREVHRNSYAQRAAANEDRTPELAHDNYQNLHSGRNAAVEEDDERPNDNSDYRAQAAPGGAKRLSGRSADQPQSGYYLNPEFNNFRTQKNVPNKNLADDNNAGNILFENAEPYPDQPEKASRIDYKAAESQEHMRYPRKNNNAAVQVDYSTRERRALQETNDTAGGSNLTGDSGNSPDEDEEAAIKRHVKKLSIEELNKFMSSLSEDKRDLLKKIMSDDSPDINKREIIKKTGAALDDNTLSECVSEQPESSKLSEHEVTTTIAPEASVVEKQAKQLGANIFLAKEGGNETSGIIDSNPQETDLTATSTVSDTSKVVAQEPSKTNKRDVSSELESIEEEDPEFEEDINAKDLQYLTNESGHYCQGREIADSDPQSDGYSNNFKREAHDDVELKNSMKSLEESFPNSNSYDDDDPYSGSDMAPLIRVKRDEINLPMKKRSAGILPEAKVGFCPYRSENDDEDNDEGNEFDDEGFYERGSNLVPGKEELENNPVHLKSDLKKCQLNKLTENSNLINDKTNLGTDSDGVVTGVEGADENLMFSGGSRSKRTEEESKKAEASVGNAKNNDKRIARSTPSADSEANPKTDNNAPVYNENDSFGGLSRTYEGELSRYKRIRRVKQPAEREAAPNN